MGTLLYCSPEIILNTGFEAYDGIKADIFSLGFLLFLKVTGNKVENEFINCKKEYNYDKFLKLLKIKIKNTSTEFQELIIKMTDFNPEKRPSIEDILDSQWMREVLEDDLEQEKDIYNEFKRREILMEKTKKNNI